MANTIGDYIMDSNDTGQLKDNMTSLTDAESTTAPTLTAMVSLTVPAIMFALGVFGNALALIILSRSPKEHKRTVFYRLMGGLALTDLVGTTAVSPVTLLTYSNNLQWVGGQPLCDYFSFMLIFFGFATVFLICSMAMDRYIALRKPYFYSAKITHQKAKYILLTIWGLAFLVACCPLLGLGKNVKHFPGSWCFFEFNGETIAVRLFAYLYSIIGLMVICSIFVLNTCVIFTLCKMRKVSNMQNQSMNVKAMDSEIQMVILLVGILAVFGVCYAPLMVS